MQFAAFIAAGLLLGLLVNYLADVLPITRRFSPPACPNCAAPMAWSRYITGEACPSCGRHRRFRYWLVWICFLATILFLWIYPNQTAARWLALLTAAYFGLVAVIDLEHRLVLHPVSLAGAMLGFGVGYALHGFWLTLLGGLAGFGIMLVLYWLGGVFARWMARRRGQDVNEVALGFGDVNLAGICGLMLGWPGAAAGLVLGILLGGAASLAVILWQLARREYQPFTAIPYAPYIILGTVILLLRALVRL